MICAVECDGKLCELVSSNSNEILSRNHASRMSYIWQFDCILIEAKEIWTVKYTKVKI